MADIFLSHSSADNELADQIKSWLERDRRSWSVFLDKHPRDGILAGQGWQDRLRSELQSCRLVLAVITPDWLASRWCFTEGVIAEFRGKDFVGVLPVQISDAVLEAAPPIVHERQRQPLDCITGAGWEELLYALDRSGLDPSQWFPISKDVGPYPGFVAFEEKDAGVFFGREREITEYLDALNLLKASDRAQALVISGGSGSGKSSLMKAGLIPRLRQQPGWLIIAPFDLSREPILALFSVLREAAQQTRADITLPQKPPQAIDELTDILIDAFRAIEEKAKAWLLLPLDQAEALLAGLGGGTKTEAARLLASIGNLLAGRTRKLVTVFTIRTEFMPALERALTPGVELLERSLRPITALSEIIEKPAERFGIELEEGLTARMVEDTRTADALPLLAYTLHELNETYGRDKRLTLHEYEQLGGVEGAIDRKLHEALSVPQPTREELTALRRCLVRQLVKVDESAVEGERYLRTAVARNALPAAAGRLIGRLREARLLIDSDQGITVGIAHERLIRNWPDLPLQTWLSEDRNDRKLIDTLKSFLAAHRDGGPLLSEKPLLDAKDLLARDHALKDDEPELARYIEDSDAAEQTRQTRRKWLFAGAVAASIVFLIVAIGAVLFFLQAREQTVIANLAIQDKWIALGRALGTVGRQQTDEGNATLGMLIALEVLPRQGAENHPFVPNAEASLLHALFAQREKYVLRGHTDGVDSAKFSPDGRLVVTGSRDHTARLWSVETGKALATLKGHDGQVYWAEFSPDGGQVVTASSDGTARLWDVETGTTIAVLQGHKGDVFQAIYSPDGRQIVTASADRTARLWNAQTGVAIVTLAGHGDEVFSAAFSPDGKRVVTGSADGTARLWNTETGELIAVLKGHEKDVLQASFSPDGKRIITASWDGTAKLWDGRNGTVIETLKGHGGGVGRAVFSRDGRLIATTSADGTARLWDGATGAPKAVLKGHRGQVYDARFSSHGQWLLTAADDNTAQVWDVGTGDTVVAFRGHTGRIWSADFARDGRHVVTASEDNTARIWDPDPPIAYTELRGHDGAVHWTAFSPPDGSRLVTVSEDGTARIWDGTTGADIAVLNGESGAVWYAAFAPGGKQLVTTSADGTAILWDAETGRLVHKLKGHKGLVFHAHFSPDGKQVVTGGAEGTARVWDVASGETVAVLEGHKGFVNFVEYAPAGNVIVTASQDGTVRLWNASSHELIAEMTGHKGPVINGAFSPDGRSLVTVSWDRTARLWDGATGKALGVLEGHSDAVLSASFSTDGARIVTGSSDNTARIWDPVEGKPLFVLRGHEGEVHTASFSPDGRVVLTASTDGTARLWHAASGLPVAILEGHGGNVANAAFARDGQRIATASWDGTARLWMLPVGTGDDWIKIARETVPRDLSNDERRFYLEE